MADKDGRRIFDSENLPLFGTWTGDSETLLSRANVARLPWVSSPVRSIELLTAAAEEVGGLGAVAHPKQLIGGPICSYSRQAYAGACPQKARSFGS
jgi:hypothetical protein